MKKKILIGSLLVLTLLLLMPSIPAIQQKTIEEGIKQDIQEKLDTINVDDLKDIRALDWIRHPILYAIVIAIVYIRGLQFSFNFAMAVIFCSEIVDEWGIEITHPILFIILMLRCAWFYQTTWFWLSIWQDISDEFGWDWNISTFA